MFVSHISDKGLMSKIHWKLIQLNNKKQTIQLKMGRGPEQTLSQRRHKNGQQIQKKLLNITSIQKDLIQSYGEIQKTVWQFLRKLKTELPYDPAVPLLITYSDKTVTQNDTPVFTVGFPGGATGKEPAL